MADRDGWDRLRPCGIDLSKFVKWGNVVMGGLFLAVGILGFVTFFTNPGGNALRVVILVYIWYVFCAQLTDERLCSLFALRVSMLTSSSRGCSTY